MKVIAIMNQKGGVGKTTSTINIGAGLNLKGRKVVVADLDPQSHTTFGLGITEENIDGHIGDVLLDRATLRDVLLDRGGLWVIPATKRLAEDAEVLSGKNGREQRLKKAIRETDFSDRDYLFIDCPPNLGVLTVNALTAADQVYIPITTEFLPLHGASLLMGSIGEVKAYYNPSLTVGGVIGTRYDGRRVLNREVSDRVREFFGDSMFNTVIRENVALGEAPSFGGSIFEHAPRSHGAVDYMALCDEIMQRG